MQVTPQQGDVGTRFGFPIVEADPDDPCDHSLDVPVDLTDAISVTVTFLPPGEAAFERTGTVTDAPAGLVEYLSVPGDLSWVGEWQAQAYVVTPDGAWHSDIVRFTVDPNLGSVLRVERPLEVDVRSYVPTVGVVFV